MPAERLYTLSTVNLIPGIGGIDEAGRGPLAGPVIAAVVILAPGQVIDGVRDSKQLTARQRDRIGPVVEREALAWALGSASAREIDRLNILQATMLAMQRAVAALDRHPECLRVDGNRAPDLNAYPGLVETLVAGDRLCPAIAAASILAKRARDRRMLELDRLYPVYGFAKHKGYPTAAHRELLRVHGPCPEHRRSFRPVRDAEFAPGLTE